MLSSGGSAAMIASRSAYSASSISGAAASPTGDQSVRRMSPAAIATRSTARPSPNARRARVVVGTRRRRERDRHDGRPREHVVGRDRDAAVVAAPARRPTLADATGLDDELRTAGAVGADDEGRRRPGCAAARTGRVGRRAEHRGHGDARWIVVDRDRHGLAVEREAARRGDVDAPRRRDRVDEDALDLAPLPRRRARARRSCTAPRWPDNHPAPGCAATKSSVTRYWKTA